MTTNQYRFVVFSQLGAIGVLGLISIIIIITAIPKFYSRIHLADAIKYYESGSEQKRSKMEKALNEALASDPMMAPAHALSGLIALRQDRAPIARDAYEKLEQSLTKDGKSTAPALNGIGCTILLSVREGRGDKAAQLKEADAKFMAATELDPDNGDAYVNAAICSLYQGRLGQAAVHLARARKTRSLNYESLIAYHSAMGSLLSQAVSRGRSVTADVARRLKDPDTQLRKTGRMLVRSVEEFRKASALTGAGTERGVLERNSVVAQVRLLAFSGANSSVAKNYRGMVAAAVSKYKKHFAPEQRQLALVVVGVSYQRGGDHDVARGFMQRAVQAGPMSPKTSAYVGSALFYVAQSAHSTSRRTDLEKQGSGYLLTALGDVTLPPRMRFRALSDRAVGLWRTRNRQGAITHMREAERVLAALEETSNMPSKQELALFYRNLAIMHYQRGATVDAIKAAQKALKFDKKQKGVMELLGRSKVAATVINPRLMTGSKQPPSMPVVSVEIFGGGVAPPKKEEIKVKIDGDPVTFIIGPNSRIYALPRRALSQGAHTLSVTVSPAGDKPLTVDVRFKIEYGMFNVGRLRRND